MAAVGPAIRKSLCSVGSAANFWGVSLVIRRKEKKEEDFNLKDSMEKAGCLVPCIEAADGSLVDGEHRRKEKPSWPTVRVPSIDTPAKKEIARLIINVHRRTPDFHEKRESLRKIVELTGWSPQELIDNLPFSKAWVYKYLPSDLKRKWVREKAKSPQRGLSRAQESKALAIFLKEMDAGPIKGDSFAEAVKQMKDPSLPFPECKCRSCPRYKECYKLK